ncbi:hypothetical protein C0995_013677 [Termitomyces sp. Mi166|nr:hypothetical protein C0995_013677 [Termitomyces sp. Mi166\
MVGICMRRDGRDYLRYPSGFFIFLSHFFEESNRSPVLYFHQLELLHPHRDYPAVFDPPAVGSFGPLQHMFCVKEIE